MPLAEDHRRQCHVAASCRHVGDELRVQRQHEVAAGERAEHAVAGEREVAQADHRHPGRIDHCRVLAGGAQAQAQARAVEQPPHGEDEHESEIDQRRVAEEAGEHGADQRHFRDGGAEAGEPRLEPHGVGDRQRLPALLEPGNAEHDSQAGGRHRDRHAHHHLVAAVADAAVAVQHRQRDADRDRGQQRQRQRAGHRAGAGGSKRGGEHLAFETEVDHTGTLAHGAGKRAQDQRRGHAQRRCQDGSDGECDLIHAQPRPKHVVPAAAPTTHVSTTVPPPAPSHRRTRRSILAA